MRCPLSDHRPVEGSGGDGLQLPQRRTEMSSALAAVGEEEQVALGSPERPEALGLGSPIL